MNPARLVSVILGLVVLLGIAVFFFFRYAFNAEGLYRVQTAVGLDATPPERHIVAEDFQGWAVLHFGVAGTEPLTTEGEILVIEYPPSGRLETSTPASNEEGFLHRQYFRRTTDGLLLLTRTGEVWGEYNMRVATDDQGEVTQRSTGFFVGSMSEFRAAERPHAIPELPELPTPED